MEVIYGLIPAMIFLGLVMVGVFFWAVKSGQYEDLEGDANRILMDDDPVPGKRKSESTGKESVKGGKGGASSAENRNWPDAD